MEDELSVEVDVMLVGSCGGCAWETGTRRVLGCQRRGETPLQRRRELLKTKGRGSFPKCSSDLHSRQLPGPPDNRDAETPRN